MPRVFVSATDIDGSRVTVAGDEAHHLAHVRRLRPGDTFTAIDPDGLEHDVVISAIDRRHVVGEIAASRLGEAETRLRITLHQAVPRGKRFPLILQKCTELGVARFVPMLTEHTVVEVSEGSVAQRLERWTKIVREACKQCGRASCPQVSAPLTWKQALDDWRAASMPGVLFHERLAQDEQRRPARDILAQFAEARVRAADNQALFIGPEGGFAPAEVQSGLAAGLTEAPLGARVLRVETAAIVAVALCLYEAGDI